MKTIGKICLIFLVCITLLACSTCNSMRVFSKEDCIYLVDRIDQICRGDYETYNLLWSDSEKFGEAYSLIVNLKNEFYMIEFQPSEEKFDYYYEEEYYDKIFNNETIYYCEICFGLNAWNIHIIYRQEKPIDAISKDKIRDQIKDQFS